MIINILTTFQWIALSGAFILVSLDRKKESMLAGAIGMGIQSVFIQDVMSYAFLVSAMTIGIAAILTKNKTP